VTLTDKAYNVLKFVALVLLPALGALYAAISGLWGLPSPEAVVGTVTAVDAFLGVVLHLSTASYNTSDSKYAGVLHVEPGEDGSQLRLKSLDSNAVLTQDEVTFKVNKGDPPILP
jgi:hypothetical protein